MTEFVMNRQFTSIEKRTRGSLAVSAVVHIALLLLLVLGHQAAPEALGLAEITWIDAADPTGRPDAAPPVAREETKSAPVAEVKMKAVARRAEKTERFERSSDRGEVSPRPMAASSVSDLMADKLDAWERDGSAEHTRLASMVPPPQVGVPALAGAPDAQPGPRGTASSLERGTRTSSGPPGVLKRSAPRATVPIASVAVAAPAPGGKASPAPAELQKRTRELAGAQLVGPVADRPLITHQIPPYPEWAKRDGVEAAVTLYFHVLPDGRVKENIVIERTGGFEDFDRGSLEALRAWRFQAIPGSSEQWGRITFNFRLSDVQ